MISQQVPDSLTDEITAVDGGREVEETDSGGMPDTEGGDKPPGMNTIKNFKINEKLE